MQITYHPAELSDAAGLSAVLEALCRAGKRHKAGDAAFVRTHYIRHPDQLACTVATDETGVVLGFQSLKRAVPGNPYGAPVGWGVIGTHIHPNAARCGIGRGLFAVTTAAARQAGLPAIDALIGAANAEGLGYYAAMGFVDHRSEPGGVGKAFHLPRG